MHCDEFHAGLQDFLDGSLPAPSDAMEAHGETCSECRATLVAALDLSRGLRLLPAPAPSSALAGRIAVAVIEARLRQRRNVRWTGMTAAVAAGLWLALTTLGRLSRGPEVSVPVEHPTAQAESPAAVPSAVSLSLDDSVTAAGSALTSLVEITARETVKQGQVLLPDKVPTPALASLDTLQRSLEPSTQSLRQAGENLTASLEPVTASARRAYLTFVQELSPPGEPQ